MTPAVSRTSQDETVIQALSDPAKKLMYSVQTGPGVVIQSMNQIIVVLRVVLLS